MRKGPFFDFGECPSKQSGSQNNFIDNFICLIKAYLLNHHFKLNFKELFVHLALTPRFKSNVYASITSVWLALKKNSLIIFGHLSGHSL